MLAPYRSALSKLTASLAPQHSSSLHDRSLRSLGHVAVYFIALLCVFRYSHDYSNNKRDGPLLVLFRFELCRLICFTNKIVITHFVEASFVSFAAEQAHRLIHSAASPLDFEPAYAGLQNRKVKMFSLLLPSHNLHQMSQCSVFKVHLELSLIEIFIAEDFNQPSSHF